LLASREDVNPFLGRGRAARDELRTALDLAEADPAHRDHGKAGVIAEMRDEDAGLVSHLDEVCPLFDLDLASVDLELDLGHALSPSEASRCRSGSASRECAAGIHPGTSSRSPERATPPRLRARRSCSPRSDP